MTIIFVDGFESNDFTAWSFTEGSPAISSRAHHGRYSATSPLVNADRWWKSFAAQSDLYVRFYVMFPETLNLAWIMLGGTAENTWTNFSWLGLSSDGATWANVHFSDEVGPLPFLFVGGQWYCIEVERKIGDASNGKIKAWVNGVLYLNVTKAVSLGAEYWISGVMDFFRTTYFDCYVIADSYIGTDEISTLYCNRVVQQRRGKVV